MPVAADHPLADTVTALLTGDSQEHRDRDVEGSVRLTLRPSLRFRVRSTLTHAAAGQLEPLSHPSMNWEDELQVGHDAPSNFRVQRQFQFTLITKDGPGQTLLGSLRKYKH